MPWKMELQQVENNFPRQPFGAMLLAKPLGSLRSLAESKVVQHDPAGASDYNDGVERMTIPAPTDDNLGGRGPARPRHLEHAPITEALIDVRVQLEEGFSVKKFDELTRLVEGEYPTPSVILTVVAKLALGGPVVRQNIEHGERGIIVKSPDEKTLAQFRMDGFTLNRLDPYTSWEEIYPEAIRLWRLYAEVAKPVAIVRLATRYINKLKLPLLVADLRDYLIAPPRVPEGLPQVLQGYLTRLVIHEPSEGHSAIVTQSLEPDPMAPDRVTILLDIDAFKTFEEVFLRPTEHAEIDRVLTRLRKFKNDIFFGSITQRASELFE